MKLLAVLLLAFFVHERFTPEPFVNLKVVFAPPMPRLLVLVGFVVAAPNGIMGLLRRRR